jgi:hypothetical protein
MSQDPQDNPLRGLGELLDRMWQKHAEEETSPARLGEQFASLPKTRHFPSGTRNLVPEE